MRKLYSALLVFSILMIALPYASAQPPQNLNQAQGVSNLTFSSPNLTVAAGTTKSVKYIVNLVNGTSGSTNLFITNLNQLNSEGINAQMSNSTGNPTFYGSLIVQTIDPFGFATPGNYSIKIIANGADPTAKNITFPLKIVPAPPTPKPKNSTTTPVTKKNTSAEVTNSITNSTNSTALQTLQFNASSYLDYPANDHASTGVELLVLLVVVIAGISAYLIHKEKKIATKLAMFSALLVVIGILSFSYLIYVSSTQYAWPAVLLIVIGVFIWAYAHYLLGTFTKRRVQKKLAK